MKKWTEEELKLLEKYYNEGLTYRQIARLLGRSEDAVDHALRNYRHVLELNRSREHRKYSYRQIFEEVKSYIDDNLEIILEKNFQYFNKIPFKGSYKKEKQSEDLVGLLSDMHIGSVNKAPITGGITFNDDILKKEVTNYIQGVKRFYELYKPSYNIEHFYVFDLGDIITGDRIYEGQLYEITRSVGQQVVLALDYLSHIIVKMSEIFPRVTYIKMVGNHGRSYSDKNIAEPIENNFEYLLGLLLKERFKSNKRVNIVLPNDYFYSVQIRNHKYLLMHGDYIRGTVLTTIEKAVKEITLLLGRDFHEVITIGHFHSTHELPIGSESTLLINGCFIYKDSYAYKRLRKFSVAKQLLFNVSKKSALHNLQKIDLRWSL